MKRHCALLIFGLPFAGCNCTSSGEADPSDNESSMSGSASGGSAATGMGATGGNVHFFGDVEVPGLGESACAQPLPERTFSITTDANFVQAGPYVVLTGTLPDDIDGSPMVSVRVNGSPRGVRFDPLRGTWSYFLLDSARQFEIVAEAESGARQTLQTTIATLDEPLALRDIEFHHTAGTWMFASFDDDSLLDCASAWRPVGGWQAWDGSVEWARGQLMDQIAAGIDVVGVRIETRNEDGQDGYLFGDAINVLRAANELIEEGINPPRLLPWLDLEAIGTRYEQMGGMPLDLTAEPGRAELYAHVRAFYDAAESVFAEHSLPAAIARFSGEPAVALGSPGAILGADNQAVLDLKARFVEDFTGECYLIAHQHWGDASGIDELTRIIDSSSHFEILGRDSAAFATIALTPGAWDPLGEGVYLPREGGTYYEQAWQSAIAERDTARHLWIDSWNDVVRGTGLFAAEPESYGAADLGPCGEFQNPRAESWGASARHYIESTKIGASAWSNAYDSDAWPVAGDVPERMRPGERRYVTVAMRNTGDVAWNVTEKKAGITFSSAAEDFHIDDLAAFQSDPATEHFGGVVTGMTGIFTVLLTAPCMEGSHLLSVEIYDAKGGGFGTHFRRDISVERD